ncbi:MAG: hypothetical protein V3S41_04950 [Spirochaetia bacterium]
MNPELVEQAVEYAKAHDSEVVPYDDSGHDEKFGKLDGLLPEERGGPAGMIVRHGYIVAEWGDVMRAELMEHGKGSRSFLRNGSTWPPHRVR